MDNVLSIGIWRRLKRDRDIGRKAVLSDVKTAFTFTPALISFNISPGMFLFMILVHFVYANSTYGFSIPRGGGGGVLPNMGYIDMCGPKG